MVHIFECMVQHYCPVAMFIEWKHHTMNMQTHVQDCCIVFETSLPYLKLSLGRCAAILKGVAAEVGLDMKLGVMAGINAAIEPDTIFCLGGWHNPNMFWCHYVTRTILNMFTDMLFDVDNLR
ncbi:uncharacterized protein ACA1_307020 [Acanthamoeba castellanii str. Neff]|uniref:Uncharacterized protein n=1 Tax=Acanthamoeba castellanii (strain ATCC 30010 / Neff) TaxID=1257118 RepID=L8GWL3_ACACF|nr:uncharacterized protein ACA1_307020 [Acanthamoeba castellanii str. Neff]ELR16486.1 hypothetical protein ACA1_307020 [Acanthamoeba castellanii str. Neff]